MEDILAILAEHQGEIPESHLLLTMMSVMLTAGVCSVLFTKLKLPPIIGYLLAGILIVNIFNLNTAAEFDMTTISVLKSIGLVMLMFGIGTELSIEKIKKCGKFAGLVAIIQLPLMVLSGYFFGMILFGLDPIGAITLGAVISGSSTAVVAAVLKTQKRITQEDAETLILVTIVEDIGQVIILSILTPILATGDMNMDIVSMVQLILKIIIFMVVSVIIGVKVVPRVLDWVGDNTNAEVLLVFSVGLCFMMAWLSVYVGMSMAIGAFLMGVMVSQSKFSVQVQEKTEPMKELFMAVFFISVGMEVTFNGFINSLPMAIGITLVFMISKFITVYLGYFVGGKNFEVSFVSSVSLMAMGEFAFIISSEAYSKGVVSEGFYTAVIGAALITMVALPIMSKGMYKVVDKVENDCPKPIATVGGIVYGIRDDINAKLEASPSTKEYFTAKLKKTYFCAMMIILIEIIFSSTTVYIADFLTRLLTDYIGDNSNTVAYIITMVTNFFLLVVPTWSLIASIKGLNEALLEGEKAIAEDVEDEAERTRLIDIYRKFLGISTLAIVIAIDFVIMACVPGPFGFSDKTSLIAIPIGVLVLLLAIWLSNRKEKKEKKQAEMETEEEQKENDE